MSNEIEPNWRIPNGTGRQRGIEVIGCGGIVTGAHLPAYRAAGLDVLAVYDVDGEKAGVAAATLRIGTVADSVETLLDTSGVAHGAQALVAVNHYNLHGDAYAEMRFLGTKATLEGTIGLMYDYPNGRIDTLGLYRDGAVVQAYEFDTRWIPDAFLGPMSDLMDAIETGRPPATAGRDILNTVAVAQAAYLSAAERRSVRLDEITGSAP